MTQIVFKVLKADHPNEHMPFTDHTFAKWESGNRYHPRPPIPYSSDSLVTHVAHTLQNLIDSSVGITDKAHFVAFDWPHVVNKLAEAEKAELRDATETAARLEQERLAKEAQSRADSLREQEKKEAMLAAAASHAKQLLQGCTKDEINKAFSLLDRNHDGYLTMDDLELWVSVIFNMLHSDVAHNNTHVPFTEHTFSHWDPNERYQPRTPAFQNGELVTTHVARALLQLQECSAEKMSLAQFARFEWPKILDSLKKAVSIELQEATAAAARAIEQQQQQEKERQAKEAAGKMIPMFQFCFQKFVSFIISICSGSLAQGGAVAQAT
jgi:hypothetical protein